MLKPNNYNDLQLSIIIINYNTFELTCQCIESIYDYTKDVLFEIILVDNGSTECDVDLFLKFPNIHLIKSKENLGFSKGNNLGIKQAKGNFILLLNSDTKLKDNAIKTTLEYIIQRPKAGVVSSKLIYPDGNHQSVCQRFPSIRYQLFELLHLNKLFSKKAVGKILLGAFFNHNENIMVDWVWGAYFLFRKEVLKNMPEGKLNEKFFMYCEDIQWCLDIQKLGYQIHYYPEAEIIHYMGGSSGKKNELIEKNTKLFLKKNYNFIHRWCIIVLNKLLAV